MVKCIMIQGTMSNAGKSFLVAGICRILRQDGYRVAPFKSQNMALNSYITEDGLEMGRAQVMQAEACGIEPTVYMNPILLKPTTDVGSQVIVNGIPRGNMRASDYFKYKTELIPDILNAWQKLSEEYDVIVIEGAGSPAEINLKKNDIVNMGLAELVDAPVLLVGDIDRGGVFAQLAGTLALLDEAERQRIKGFVMNKFRGDVEILRPGLDMLLERCHVETIGVIPYTYLDLDDEDSLSERLTGESEQAGDRSAGGSKENKSEKPIDESEKNESEKPIGESEKNESEKTDEGFKEGNFGRRGNDILRIAVIRLPRISNFTDFNVLQAMDGVKVTYVSKASELGEPHMVILPGTKSTIADMRWLRESGLEAAILKLHSRGVTVFGICGGFQMLGERISDPLGVETAEATLGSENQGNMSNGENCERNLTTEKQKDAGPEANAENGLDPGEKPQKMRYEIPGMGILPMETVFCGEKVRKRVTGTSGNFSGDYAAASGKRVTGYEIHMGQSVVEVEAANKCQSGEISGVGDTEKTYQNSGMSGRNESGLVYQKENTFGTYVHGVFDEQEFRESFLGAVAKKNGIQFSAQTVTDYRAYKESQYDRLADAVRGGMDMKKFYEILGLYPEKYFSEEDDACDGKENTDTGDPLRAACGNSDDFDNKKDVTAEICAGSKRENPLKAENGNQKKENPIQVEKGFLHLYYGDGKGKTTAAVGLAVRAAGAGKKVVFCQFLKSGDSAELSVLSCTPGVRILRSEEKFGFSWTLTGEEKERLKKIHTDILKEAMRLTEAGLCDVLILDEICDALRKDLLDANLFYRYLEEFRAGNDPEECTQPEYFAVREQREDVGRVRTEKTVENEKRCGKKRGCEWVLTGRDPDERILAAADYVTQMKKERHPFDSGVRARRGIEY